MSLINVIKTYFNDARWTQCKRVRDHKIVKTTYLWLILIPIILKINDFIIENQPFHPIIDKLVNFELPFSWLFFYLAAVFFTIGNIIYHIKCPRIIKDYDSYADFFSKEKNSDKLFDLAYDCKYENDKLLNELQDILNVEKEYFTVANFDLAFDIECSERDLILEERKLINNIRSRDSIMATAESFKSKCFEEISNYEDLGLSDFRCVKSKLNKLLILSSKISIHIGFLLLLVVFLENFISVLKYLFF